MAVIQLMRKLVRSAVLTYFFPIILYHFAICPSYQMSLQPRSLIIVHLTVFKKDFDQANNNLSRKISLEIFLLLLLSA